jgi:selenocysteine lyase/cysteine desulfurase
VVFLTATFLFPATLAFLFLFCCVAGVLVVNRSMFDNAVPAAPGGGTVDYTARHPENSSVLVAYTSNVTEREEAGTPVVLSDIRAGTGALHLLRCNLPCLSFSSALSTCVERIHTSITYRILGICDRACLCGEEVSRTGAHSAA